MEENLKQKRKKRRRLLFSYARCKSLLVASRIYNLRWLNTILAVCEYMSFATSWQEKGCSSQAETWQVKNILLKNFNYQVKCDVFEISMAT